MMLPALSALLACMAALFRSRASLHLEHLALRHQLAVWGTHKIRAETIANVLYA